jgi:hypothetical protein
MTSRIENLLGFSAGLSGGELAASATASFRWTGSRISKARASATRRPRPRPRSPAAIPSRSSAGQLGRPGNAVASPVDAARHADRREPDLDRNMSRSTSPRGAMTETASPSARRSPIRAPRSLRGPVVATGRRRATGGFSRSSARVSARSCAAASASGRNGERSASWPASSGSAPGASARSSRPRWESCSPRSITTDPTDAGDRRIRAWMDERARAAVRTGCGRPCGPGVGGPADRVRAAG